MAVVLRNAADVANGGKKKKTSGGKRKTQFGAKRRKPGRRYPLAGKDVRFNKEGDVRREVVDADNFDFRPRKGSRYNEDMVGPYRYDPSSKYYWIPGRQLYKASTPVPPDGSTTVKVNVTKNSLSVKGWGRGQTDIRSFKQS